MHIDNEAVMAAQTPAVPSPDMYRQLGLLTRQLHDTLTQLGVMP